MKRIRRKPQEFESIDLFAEIGIVQGFTLNDPSSDDAFQKNMSDSLLRSKANPIVIHGRRVQSMFGYVAASLGACTVIKEEDRGQIFANDHGIRPPDYRLVLSDGSEFFVEVKNHRPKDPTSPYIFRKPYFDSLISYAKSFKRDIKTAIYWSQWNIWTLTPVEALVPCKQGYSLEMSHAAKSNEMSVLGDCLFGVEPPIELRLLVDQSKPIVSTGTEVNFTIGGVELYCGNRLIQTSREKNLLLYFILFGRWIGSDPQPQIDNGYLMAVHIVAEPETRPKNQPFALLGAYSGMISRYYDFLTASEHGVERIIPSREPGSLGISIPESFEHLRLWRFYIKPNQSQTQLPIG